MVILAQLSRTREEKKYEPLLNVLGWKNGQITITAARYYSHIIRGAQLPIPLQDRETDWGLESGIGLAG